MKTGAHPQTDWKTKSPRKILARAFKWGCSFIFSARRGRLRRRGGVLRIRGEFHHGGICAIRLCAACASNAHNENRGHNTRGSGFCAPFSLLFNGEIFVPQKEAGPASCEGLRLRPRNGMRKLRPSGSYAPPRRFPAAPAAVFTGFRVGKRPANKPAAVATKF